MEDALEEEETIVSLIQSRYVPFMLEAINQLKKKGSDIEKLQKLNSLHNCLTLPSKEEKVSNFKKNRVLLETLYGRYERVRQLRQGGNRDVNTSSLSSALPSTSKLETKISIKEGYLGHLESNIKNSKMNKGFSPGGEPSPLQILMSCKLCAFVGQTLVKHYVEGHPGAEIPVCLTPKELNVLKSNAETPVPQTVDSAVEENRIEIVINFLKKLGQASSFRESMSCPLCSYNSHVRADIINHLLIHETSNLMCYFCQVTETNLNDFRDHVSTHTGEYAYQCIHCKFRGASSTDVAQHISQNHPGKEAKTIFENVFNPDGGSLKGYVCSTCGFIQMAKSSVEKHVSSVDLFCRGSYVIELDLSKGRKGSNSATVVKGNYIPTATDSSEYIVPSSEAQAVGRNVSNLDSSGHGKSMIQNRVYIQDEIEIAPPDPHTDSILPFNDDNNQSSILKIKTEKIDDGYNQHVLQSQAKNDIPNFQSSFRTVLTSTLINQADRPESENITSKTLKATQMNTERGSDSQTELTVKKAIDFTCASCQFSTLDEAQFIKHARTDHRSDLSLWCKNCGKCFSNAGVLVTHIKESSCVKEDMIYRCGVKECTFETPSGQTFVHHLRHCHKGSPFIFCVHCQKIFTLPHCLILHMQNECPYKDKNRVIPGQAPAVIPSLPKPTDAIEALKQAASAPLLVKQSAVKQPISSRVLPDISSKIKTTETTVRGGKIKVKGRGRGKVVTDSSDSDPDDPPWTPSDVNTRSLRRSSRTARKSETSDSDHSTNKSLLEGGFSCACCDYNTKSNALLEEHYLSTHKKPGKIGCSICNLKFESTQNFLDHFVLHKKESGSNSSKSSEAGNVMDDAPNRKGSHSKRIKRSSCNKANTSSSVVQIPYQAAIHEKNQKDNKLKNFEELKSKEDLSKMKEPVKLKHFFKCMLYGCTFTTDNSSYFISHLNDSHCGKRFYCPFCFEEYDDCKLLTNHMIEIHGKRCYQCSVCFYRAFSKPHVQIHIKNFHSKGKNADVFTCTTHISHLPPDASLKTDECTISTEKTTWPFRCAIGECKFETFEPNEFKKHNEITHRAVSVFICYYCKAEFISFKRLMNHYRLHGINNFQCTYCLHGSDTKEEILAHVSQSHADKPIQIHVRAPQDSPFSKDTSRRQSSEQTTTNMDDDAKKPEDQRFQKKYGKNTKAPESCANDTSLCLPLEIPVHNIKKEPIFEKCYVAYVENFENQFSCGIPNCGKQFDNINFYLKHLKLNHLALNVICPYCYEAMKNESEFKDHLSFHGPNLYACSDEMCNYSHWNESEVKKHTETKHGKELDIVKIREQSAGTPFVAIPEIECVDTQQNTDYSKGSLSCPFCNYKTYNRVMIKKHIYIEMEYIRFQCYFCNTKFSTRKEILSHFLSEHPNGSILSSMDIDAEIEYLVKAYIFCLQNMPSGETEMEKSRSSFKVLSPLEGESKPTLSCTNCQKMFTRSRDWHNHLSHCLMQHFNAYVLKYVKCHYCELTCSRISFLKLHANLKHPGKQPRHSEIPNRLEWMKEKLVTVRLQFLSFVIGHLIKNCSGLVLGDLQAWQKDCKLETKLYKCFYCPFTNDFRFNVERHLTSSHNDRPIKIERLTKSFFTAGSSINLHSKDGVFVLDDSKILPISKKNEIQQTKEIICGICPREFSYLENLKQHAVLDHAFQTNDSFPYYYCPVSGSTLSVGEKTFCCAYCKSGDMIILELKLHHDSLHAGLPFKASGSLTIETNSSLTVKCGYCSKTFITRSEFYKHCNIAHSQFPVKEFSEVSSDSKKRKFGFIDDDNSLSYSSVKDCSITQSMSKKAKYDDLYICCYCHVIFPSFEKIKAHFFILHPCLPLKYEGMSIPLKENRSISFGVTDFLKNISSMESSTSTQHVKSEVAEHETYSTGSHHSDNICLDKISLQLAVKSGNRSLKFPIMHLSQIFPLFPSVSLTDIMKPKQSPNSNVTEK